MAEYKRVVRFGKTFEVPSSWSEERINAKVAEWKDKVSPPVSGGEAIDSPPQDSGPPPPISGGEPINDVAMPPVEEREKYNYAGNLARQAGQGLTFGFGDEIEAGVRSLLPGFGSYDDELKGVRSGMRGFEQDNPITAGAANLAGAIAMPGGLARAPFAAAKLAKMGPGIKYGVANPVMGATSGAVSGFGSGEGDERVSGAVSGGVLGAGLGLALPPLVEGAVRAGQGILRRFKSPEVRAAQAASNALAHDFPNQDIGDAMTRELSDLRQSGVPPMPMDVGHNILDLVQKKVAREPGDARNTIEGAVTDRLRGVDDRVNRNIKKRVSFDTDAWTNMQALDAQRRVDSDPLYKAAFASPSADKIDTEAFRNAFDRIPDSVKKRALKEANDLHKMETGQDIPQFAAFVTDGNGSVQDLKVMPKFNTETFNAFKKGLDSTIRGMNADPNERAMARGLRKIRRSMVDEVDAVNPDYGKALKSWAGPSQTMDIIEQGKEAFHIDPRQITMDLRDIKPHERDFYKIGFASELRARLEGMTDKANKAETLLNKQEIRDRVRAIIGNKTEYEKFEKYLNAEAGTARGDARTLRETHVGEGMPREDMGIVARYGNIPVTGRGWASRAVQYLYDSGLKGLDEPTRLEMAKMMTVKDTAGQKAVIDKLRTAQGAQARRDASVRAGGTGTAIGVPGFVGRTPVQSQVDDLREEGDARRGYAEGGRAKTTTPPPKDRDPEDGDPRRGYAEGGVPKMDTASGSMPSIIDGLLETLRDVGVAVKDGVVKDFKKVSEAEDVDRALKYNPFPHANPLIKNALGAGNVALSFLNPIWQYDKEEENDTPLSRGATNAANIITMGMGPAALPGKAMARYSRGVLGKVAR